MEYNHRRIKTQTFPLRRSSTQVRFDIKQSIPSTVFDKTLNSSRTRPTTTKSKKSNFSNFSNVTHCLHTSQSVKNPNESFFNDFLQQKKVIHQPQPLYQTYLNMHRKKKLSLCQNEQILQQDAHKLQNFITGGYSCEDQFMSITKFNNAKDNFILLEQIYNKGKNKMIGENSNTKMRKQVIKDRNIFSIIYLNENLKNMGKKQTNTMFERLKLVR